MYVCITAKYCCTEIKMEYFQINMLTVFLMQLHPKLLMSMARKYQPIDDRNL